MYNPDNEVIDLGKRIRELADERDITIFELAHRAGVAEPTLHSILKRNDAKASQLTSIASVLQVPVATLIESNATALENPNYLELPYISVPARASFIEMVSDEKNYGYPDTFRVVAEPKANYTSQVIIEVDGDSMDPYYPSGTKVRCKEIPSGDWQYLNSGVYAVSYSNYFVIKRIKSNDYTKGYLVLHSDNTDTGGINEVPITQIHHMWRVLRVVDAPAR